MGLQVEARETKEGIETYRGPRRSLAIGACSTPPAAGTACPNTIARVDRRQDRRAVP